MSIQSVPNSTETCQRKRNQLPKTRKFLLATTLFAAVFATSTPAALANTYSTYTAGSNDTFWSLAHKFHFSVAALESANPRVRPTDIYAGLKIHIPTRALSPTQTTLHAVAPVANKLSINSVSSTGIRIDGVKRTYTKELSCIATAYTASRAENPWGPVDYFGNPLKEGTVAVDPSVIPLGSTLYVTGYQFQGLPTGGMVCHATDKGGSIKGRRIDIFIPTSDHRASEFGRQDVQVYLLK